MSDQTEYLIPDYYASFACKMGACRRACCEGWPISVTMGDYFRLLGVDCSPELRRRLDSGLHLALHPMPEAYAQILPRYDGQCPLHMTDGRCALQAELGEEVLADVCRLYPRGVRLGEERECSCANSCEAVVELLLNRSEPLTFCRGPLTTRLPEAFLKHSPVRRHAFHTGGRGQEIRLWLISHVQNRAYPLPQRLLLLGLAMKALDEALTARDDGRVSRLLSGAEAIPVPAMIRPDHAHLLEGLSTAERMLHIMDGGSRSIRDYGEAALAYFGEGEAAFARYTAAAAQLDRLVPQWQTWFEHLVVNHMFFAQFPFQDRPVPLFDEYVALCGVYVLLRFLCVGWTAEHADVVQAVDVASAVFRLVEHTEFDRYAAAVLMQLGCGDIQRLTELICL